MNEAAEFISFMKSNVAFFEEQDRDEIKEMYAGLLARLSICTNPMMLKYYLCQISSDILYAKRS